MPSFDIVSRTEMPEVDNAIQGAMREIGTRYDFKGSSCSIERTEQAIQIKADDDLKLKQVQELLRGYMAKRKVDVGSLDFQKPEAAFGNSMRQTVAIKQGIERELAQKVAARRGSFFEREAKFSADRARKLERMKRHKVRIDCTQQSSRCLPAGGQSGFGHAAQDFALMLCWCVDFAGGCGGGGSAAS